ncbi:MAG: bacteriohemerythrin [Dechloromonas sp.]|nr:bacteriohemerythrin [Dechloromonas sp.]
MPINWTTELDTGIEVIDYQHRQIVDFINQLESANLAKDKEKIKEVIDACVDYTLSHFAFEESLQEEAEYKYCKPHKKVHELFTRKVAEYQQRVSMGDDVADELHGMLSRWLVNHIKRDDADYVAAVKANMVDIIKEKTQKEETKGWLSRFFK